MGIINQQFISEWQDALAGDQHAQSQWQIEDGGKWSWHPEGLTAVSSGAEWSALRWQKCGPAILKDLKNFMVAVTISGKAEAAGLSFGPYKDFLASLDFNMGSRYLQLEVDTDSRCWNFRVDGQLTARQWWDSAVSSTDDIINGILTLKARRVERVSFQNLAVQIFQSSCRLSVIITCNLFLQRLRVSLRNWCHQDLLAGTHEVLIVNPNSPDGTHEYLAAVSRSYPHVRIRELAVESKLATNKGAMINRALPVSRGEWIWLTDADCLFPPNCATTVLDQIAGRKQHLFYGQRRYLTAAQTVALLSGRTDGIREFEALSESANGRAPENSPWGYTQIVHRSTLERARYSEEYNHFAHSDDQFVETCKRHGIMPEQLPGLFCLHLDHPFTWYGTKTFL